MERTFKKLITGLFVCGLLVFLANLLIDNPYMHRVLRAAINAKVKEHTNLIVDFKALRLNALPPGVDLYGVHVATKLAADTPLITASRATARLSLWSLIFGETRLSVIEGHDVAIVWPPPWDFPGFLIKDPEADQPPAGPAVWPPLDSLPVDRLILSNARIFAEIEAFAGVPHPGLWVSLAATGVDIDAALNGLDDIAADLAIKSFDLAVGANSLVESAAIQSELRLRDGKFTTESLSVKGERMELADATVSGEILTQKPNKELEGLKLVVESKLRADLSLLGSALNLGETRGAVSGKAAVQLKIPIGEHSTLGEAIDFEVIGEGKVEDGWLAGFKLFDSAAEFKVTPSAVSLPKIDIMIDGQSYGRASGVIELNETMSFAFRGEPKALRLLDLMDSIGVDFSIFDTALDSADLEVKGQGEPLRIDVTATAPGQRSKAAGIEL